VSDPEWIEPAAVPAPAPTPREPFWDYKDLALFAGMAIPSLLMGAALVDLVLWKLLPDSGKALPLLLSQFVGYGLWFSSLYWMLHARYHRPFWRSLGWTWPRRWMLASLFAGPILALGVVLVGVALRTPEVDMPMKQLMRDRFSMLLVGLFAVTLGPLCEELAFRGFLFPLLARSLGPVPAIVLSALPFALLHGPQYAWSWRHVLLIALAGMAFGWSRYRSGSTTTSVGMHCTYNLTNFTAFLAQAGG